jgi:hypothetical protein
VDWLAGEDLFTTIEAVLEDISPHGACVQLDVPIPVGSTISVSCGENHFTGFVSYCVSHENGYFVGICLSEQSKWSRETFLPAHLTSVHTVVGN